MNRKLGLIEKIVSGQKKIESRWYKNRVAPWDKVKPGEIIYFKEAGKPVAARAVVKKVMQFADLDIAKIGEIVNTYGREIDIQNWDYQNWGQGKRYCVLMWLEKPEKVEPFKIDKTGFGNGAAWLTLDGLPKF